GNYLEGNTIAERFDWKKTLGPPENRPGHPCPWGYRSTDGMGLLEFLYWCEDMGACTPRAWSSSSAPYATASLAQKTAVGRGAGPSSSSFIWSRPLCAVKSPTRIKPSSKAIPASSSAH
ncbi:MAG: hypothetical protein JWQ02_2554, partial [Capsulimonas sp.]|nr:hypothetical protein [Capsulimonas sp.]